MFVSEGFKAVYVKELRSYFRSHTAFAYIMLFLMTSALLTFQLGDFLNRNVADLKPMFQFFPFIFLFFIPALAGGLWAEEKKSGTIEILSTLPLTVTEAVTGKYFAALSFTLTALAGTFPLWITASVLGDPDHGVIISGYLGAIALSAMFLAVSAFVSGLTDNRVIAFLISAAVCFVFLTIGLPIVTDFLRLSFAVTVRYFATIFGVGAF
jgi:ABC-2 type transport system permease protein